MTNATLSTGPRPARWPGTTPAAGPVRPAQSAAPVAAPGEARTAARTAARTWTARLLVGAGLAMVPWLVYLAATLPARPAVTHWDTVWVGLDTAEAAGLFATGLLLRRADPRRSLTAAATAVLLTVDAWFDCGTAATGGDRVTALAMAAGLELPLAAALAVLAWRAFPTAGGGRGDGAR